MIFLSYNASSIKTAFFQTLHILVPLIPVSSSLLFLKRQRAKPEPASNLLSTKSSNSTTTVPNRSCVLIPLQYHSDVGLHRDTRPLDQYTSYSTGLHQMIGALTGTTGGAQTLAVMPTNLGHRCLVVYGAIASRRLGERCGLRCCQLVCAVESLLHIKNAAWLAQMVV